MTQPTPPAAPSTPWVTVRIAREWLGSPPQGSVLRVVLTRRVDGLIRSRYLQLLAAGGGAR